MIVKSSLLLIIISSPQIHIDHSLLAKYYQKPIADYNQEHIEPEESTLKYNYITTEKFIEQSILRYQDILQ